MKSFLSELRLYVCNEWMSKLPSHKLRSWYYKYVMRLELGKQVAVFMHCSFDAAQGLILGENSVVNSKCRLDTRGGIVIGSNVSISSEVVILTADHDINSPVFEGRNRSVVIGDHVWVGTRAMILPGILIGRGAVIAAGAVVTKDVPPYSIAAGVPARVINTRTSNLKYKLSYQRLFQ